MSYPPQTNNSTAEQIFTVMKPKHTLSDLVFPDWVMKEVKSVIEEEPFSDALKKYNLDSKRKILLHGPSGCGKTSIAHAFASELKIPLIVGNSSQCFGGMMGESARNVSELIKATAITRGVFLFDEFDSYAAKRGGRGESADKENNRTVNAILTDLENVKPKGLIVACTNHLEMIDDAILRRFDTILEVPHANRDVLLKIAKGILKDHFGLDPEEAVKMGGTPALVASAAKDMLRSKVIQIERARIMKQDDAYDRLMNKREGREVF